VHESSWVILIPLLILCFFSIFFGFFTKELFLGGNIPTWNNIFLVLPWHDFQFESEFLPFYIKLIPVIFSLSGGLLSFIFYKYYQYALNVNSLYLNYYNIYHFLSKKWYFDDFYTKIVGKSVLNFSYQTSFKLLDKGLIELIGPLGIVQLVKGFSKKLNFFQTGLIYNYILMIILGIIFILLLYLLPVYFTVVLFLIYFYLFIYVIFNQTN
jgi:NADH-ubiquinone oxidoreductase chain 5